ncbi:MAG: sigma-70 family RNA polymerase sigma factor [Cytophagales bacterium]|nr:sigma-70 family RNA polymerase sigma factor [Cytophagales bacterium]
MESELIQKVLEGDANAFRYFIEKYRDMAYTLAMSIVKDAPIAEEVTQDAFLKAYRSLDKFEQRSKFSTWLYKIVTNEGLKHLRKKEFKYAEDITELNNIEYSEINESISGLTEQEQKYYINRSLERLLPNDCLVLRLFYLDERSLKEIREITGFSNTNIKTILHRARKRFYAFLKEDLKHEVKSII